MEKTLKMALALFFTLAMGFANPPGYPRKISTQNHQGKAVLTRQAVVRYPAKRKEKTYGTELKKKILEAKARELRREKKALETKARELRQKEEALGLKEQESSTLASKEFDADTQRLISNTQFMCACPNAHEFLAALKSFSSSESFEKCEISTFDAENLSKKLYPNKAKEWLDGITKSRVSSKDSSGLDTPPPSPVCFFHHDGQILCLAWCGKGSFSALAFSEKSVIFNNLKHILICGICACPSEKIEVGSVFFSKKYVKISSCTMGDYHSAKSKGKEEKIYLQGTMSYFTDPKFLSYGSSGTFLHSLAPYLRDSGHTISSATNFSFDFFIDDKVLAKSIASKAGKDSVSIIDMEGAALADLFSNRGCTVHSLRIVSDHAGLSIGEIKTGKPKALEVLTQVLSPTVDFWMKNVSEKDMFLEEKIIDETKPPMETYEIKSPWVISSQPLRY